MGIYKVQMHVEGTEDDAIALRISLAQSVCDEFELNRVYGVSVDLEIPPVNTYVMALCMVELEDGLTQDQVCKVLSVLPDSGSYMPIEFHDNNTSAYGFVDSEYYQIHDYTTEFIKDKINAVLDDKRLELPDGTYSTPDGRQFYMGYFND